METLKEINEEKYMFKKYQEQLYSEVEKNSDKFIDEIKLTDKNISDEDIIKYENCYIAGYVDAFKNSKTVEIKFMDFLNTFTDKVPLSYIKSELEKGINKRIEGL